jgi:hypothetical protein
MKVATSYQEWRRLRTELLKQEADYSLASGYTPQPETKFYDSKLLHDKTKHLKRVRQSHNVKEIMFNLRLDLVRNIANIAKR